MPSTMLLPATLVATYAVLLLLLAARDRAAIGIGARRWLIPALFVAGIAAAVHVLPEDAHLTAPYDALFPSDLTPGALFVLATDLMLVFFGCQTLRYLQYRSVIVWLLAGMIWWIAQAVMLSVDPVLAIGEVGWLDTLLDPLTSTSALLIGGWIVGGVWMLGAAFIAYYRAHLPEVANRALFWAILVPLIWIGSVAGTNGDAIFAKLGWAIQFLGLLGACYSVMARRVISIRHTLRWTVALVLMVVTTTLFFFGLVMIGVQLQEDGNATPVVIIVLAAVASIFFLALQALQQVIARFWGASADGLPPLLRRYSEEIAGIVDLDALVNVTVRTVGYVLRVRRAGVILVSGEDAEGLMLESPPQSDSDQPPTSCTLKFDSPILRHLLDRRAPLLQYDLDFERVYTTADLAERAFFQSLRMSVYAPVFVQGRLVGLVCCGAKNSDDAFSRRDLEVLMTIANQVGFALRNARLVDDLRRREAEQAQLNRALSTTTDQLEKLDTVKTDFITVASHELRTPLAQIRGYTDILEAMNEEGALDEDQVTGMTSSLRKAADRLENLIGAMLDVSQIDVNAMDLAFADITVESVMRMAIEPLTESIRHRKLMLSARGLRHLPHIQADQQRLVQAFRNVITNAIKYTPDGGRIDITGVVENDEVIVQIKDSGIGIDASDQELIFKKFFRVQDPKLHSTGATKFMGGGPGLGLTIARGVIEGHGGRIWVESEGCNAEKLPGSTFFIALPLHPPTGARRVLPFEVAGQSGQIVISTSNGPRSFDETMVASHTPPQPLPAVRPPSPER
ncbi:MAG TPA: ATP-binding protein [Aggregatilinea sp.]|uniref:sensor histidine kinase n=1 Tax=Aggregatilinea sp. TaxID=2806333 RepID=UPI002B5C3CA3|nr:ATP-binding protein [Aggregatilinea sp.]HML24612.1 ATP-binding protein [Aggregatilinea sp.]